MKTKSSVVRSPDGGEGTVTLTAHPSAEAEAEPKGTGKGKGKGKGKEKGAASAAGKEPTPTVKPLSPAEQREKAQCEADIQAHVDSFRTAGAALIKMRDSRLYREGYATFEAYCRGRWGMSKSQANRLIAAADVVRNVEGRKGITPAVKVVLETLPESALRPLTGLKPAEQARALAAAVKGVGELGRVTAKTIALAAKKVAPQAFPPRSARPILPSGRGGAAPERPNGDLVRRSEVLEEITTWEKAQKKAGTFDALTPGAVVMAIRVLIKQL